MLGRLSEGGSLTFARRIEQRYLDLGGQIHYRSPVREILVENDGGGRASGGRIGTSRRHRHLRRGRPCDDLRPVARQVRQQEDRAITTTWRSSALVHVALGVARSFEGLPAVVTYALDEPS